jgi:YXWGXW repeat-containing protein
MDWRVQSARIECAFVREVASSPLESGEAKGTAMNLYRSGFVVLLATVLLMLSFSPASSAQVAVGISVRIGPPALPIYAQPLCPGPGYFWTPGYWAWDDDDGYYWVPGTWVIAPVGMLWTPGYWGWNEGLYVWSGGYWGPHIGFYGGINYGFGYTGVGFFGGEWRGDRFYYNRSVTNVNVTNVTNIYNKTVIVNNNTRVSYNGGNGGVRARPTTQQEQAAHERHLPPIGEQAQHQQAARSNRQLFASANHGRPPVAATARPAEFSRGVVRAKAAGAPYHPPKIAPREAVVRGGGGGNRSAGANNRAFTPPNKSNTAPRGNNTRAESSRSPSTARPSDNRPSANRPNESKARNDFHPPASSRSATPRTENSPSRTSDRPPTRESRPPSSSRSASAPAPRESRPPQREAAPPPQRRESASPPRRESAPPQRESAPPPQRKEAPKEHQPGK